MKVENKFKTTYNLYKENTYQYIRCHIRSDVNETKRHNAREYATKTQQVYLNRYYCVEKLNQMRMCK